MDLTGCTAAVILGFVFLCLNIGIIRSNTTSESTSNYSQSEITTTSSSSSSSSPLSSSTTTTKSGNRTEHWGVWAVAALCVAVLVAIVFAFGCCILKRHGKPIKYDVSEEKERYLQITMEPIPKIGGAYKLLGDDPIVCRGEGEENKGEEPYDHLNINGTKSNVTCDEFASKNIYDHLGKKENDYDTTGLSKIHRQPIDKPYDRAYFPQAQK